MIDLWNKLWRRPWPVRLSFLALFAVLILDRTGFR